MPLPDRPTSWLPRRLWLLVGLTVLAGAELLAVYLAWTGVFGQGGSAALGSLLLGLSLLNLLIVVVLTLGNAGLFGRTAPMHLAQETPPDDETRQRLELLQRTLDGLVLQSGSQSPDLLETFRQSTIAMCLNRARDGHVVEVNPAFTRLTGFEVAGLAGRRDFPLCPAPSTEGETHAPQPQEPIEFLTATQERRQAVIARTALKLHGDMHLLTLAVDVTPWLRSREALSEFEARYREMFRRTRAVMLLVDANSGQILEANPAAVSFYGHAPQTLRRMRLHELTEDIADEPLDGEQPLRLIQHSADGLRHAVEVYRARITLRGRRLDYLIVQDITSRVRAQTALKHSKAQIRSTLEAIPDAVLRFTSEGHIEFLNSAAQRILGNTAAAELIGRSITGTLALMQEDGDEPVDLDEIIARTEAGEEVRFMARIDSEQHGELITQANCARIAGDEEEHQAAFVLVLHDVTQLRTLSRKLSYQATHDALTGLINRREFERQVNELIREAQADGSVHMLCYIDLDQFKLVNDTSGHRAGDALLGQVSNLLAHGVRRSDIVARLGGDEFGILLSHCERPVAEDIAGKLIKSISAHRFTWEDRTFRIGASIGMVILNADTSDLQEAMSAADAACYLAKERGRNRYIVHAGAEDTVMQRRQEMEWVRLLHSAMENESFRLHYQNIEYAASATRDTPMRIELLLRLSQPDGLLVLPERFMPAAERFGLMPELDLWVVRQVCEHLADYLRRYPLSVYINLSAQSLADAGLGERIAELLEEYNVPAQRIYFDIQELAAAASLTQARLINQTLRAQGCRFSIDHYGASQPAFAHLNGLSFDQVKIDGGLITAMLSNKEARTNVVNINNICHGLGLQTIASCVESPQLLRAAEQEGIDFVEGHSVGGGVKPLSWLESELRQRFDTQDNGGDATTGPNAVSRT